MTWYEILKKKTRTPFIPSWWHFVQVHILDMLNYNVYHFCFYDRLSPCACRPSQSGTWGVWSILLGGDRFTIDMETTHHVLWFNGIQAIRIGNHRPCLGKSKISGNITDTICIAFRLSCYYYYIPFGSCLGKVLNTSGLL